jgi:hypothetical protein
MTDFSSSNDFSFTTDSRRLLVYEWRMTYESKSKSKSKSKLCYDRRSSGDHDHIRVFITVRELQACWCGALSLTRGRVSRLQLLPALASAVIFRSKSRGTRDHILLAQIRDFPFRRLLRLAGLRWRYSTPPPHVWTDESRINYVLVVTPCGPQGEHSLERFDCCILCICCHGNVLTEPLSSSWLLLLSGFLTHSLSRERA